MAGRIVVGIDGSPHSANALEWAIGRALLGGEHLELVNAYTLTPALDFYGYQAVAQPMDWVVELSHQVLDAAATRVNEVAPALTCAQVSTLGQPAVVMAAASESADAVVVGRRGLGNVASALLGSVSTRLAVQAKCPLVVVGEADVPASGPIVVGVDGSSFGANALRYAVAEAAIRRTSVRAVVAFDAFHPGFRADPELTARMRAEVEAEAADTVASTLKQIELDGLAPVDVEDVAVEGRPADVILDHAKDAQLVVVGTHGKGMVRRMLLGSVSRQILIDSDRPVAVVDL